MHQLRAPLEALLKKNVPFKWNEECEAAFNRAKEVLASDLLVMRFDPSLDIIVAADASDYGIGSEILHRMPDGTEKAICHASKDNVKDRPPTIVPPATTRPVRQRGPPSHLQADPKMKTYVMHLKKKVLEP
ncbi:hypothetical protein RB195_024291 [Necator americanus]|uniref:Reverse transcriptase/retrotransposon-derived protein RNase H-like domain-containing protein n=1 Tax=Necator americanus TaxID=51031 RepID=A0ABR1EMP2_NECAM